MKNIIDRVSPAPTPIPSPQGGGEAFLRLALVLLPGGLALPPPLWGGLGWGPRA
jgi:hypothetical protein